MRHLIVCIGLLMAHGTTWAQEFPKFNYAEVTQADFRPTSPLVDNNTEAVILHDVGSCSFTVNDYGDFNVIFKVHRRILIKNRSAFEAGTVRIALAKNLYNFKEEKLEDLQATTYNLENGHVVAVDLEKSNYFTEKLSRQTSVVKFAFPALKENSIIEYSFTIRSPFYSSLKSWRFQHNYPCLWSEYTVEIPPMFSYLTFKKGFLPFTVEMGRQEQKDYWKANPTEANNASVRYSLKGDTKWGFWAMKDVPAFRKETYIASTADYISKIEFQLESVNYARRLQRIVQDWPTTAKELLADPDFGQEIFENTGWLTAIIKKLPSTGSELEKARAAYEFVRDNVTCTDHDQLYLSQYLKEVLSAKTSNVADVNLLLVALLKKMGVQADPVIISTRTNGSPSPDYAILSQYNYVLCRAIIDSRTFMLDASKPKMGFGKLDPDCYNFFGWVIAEKPERIDLSPDLLTDAKLTNINLVNDGKGGLRGEVAVSLTYTGSTDLRTGTSSSKEIEKASRAAMPEGFMADGFTFESLNDYDNPVTIRHTIRMDEQNSDVLYFSPAFYIQKTTNPFSFGKRIFPIEMPFAGVESYTLTMDIPAGYGVEEIPKSVRLKLNENEGSFEYLVSKSGNQIQFRTLVRLQKASFQADDYNSLRDFYNYVLKKYEETIVFKKLK